MEFLRTMRNFRKNFDHKMLRAVIIDDEAPMRQSLETILKTACPRVKLVAQADGVRTGVEAIKRYHPDLVFLDIRMDDGTGFDLLKQLEPIDFKVIFITTYDQYAVKAFKFSALDYLLKPVDADELAEAVNKTDGGTVILTDGHKVPVASRKREQLLELFDRISGG